MHKGRLEAFSDGILAIIITIMVLELKAPHSANISDLIPLIPIFLSYVLSFIYIGIYWNNHHHLFQAVKNVNGSVLWANLHLMFWLSLVPFVTAWLGENHFASLTVAMYGLVLMMAGIAYYILTQTLIRHHGKDSLLAQAVGKDKKGAVSVIGYFLAIPLAYFYPFWSCAIYILIAIIWFIPDNRIEKNISK